jgi:hypothetical protein
MRIRERKIILFAFIFLSFSFFAQKKDSLFFAHLKLFYFKQCGMTFGEKLFAVKAAKAKVPFQYVYVSRKNLVKNGMKESFIYCGQSSKLARKKCREYNKQGYSAFVYKSFGTSEALITDNLLSYSNESKAFVVFHELTHNYFAKNKMTISYFLNEGTCDVLGIKFCEKLIAERENVLDPAKFSKMKASMLVIYKTLLDVRDQIKNDTLNCALYCEKAEKVIRSELKESEVFFKDRYNYPVNTAFILKNLYYCEYYFRIEKIYDDSKGFEEFIKGILKLNEEIK